MKKELFEYIPSKKPDPKPTMKNLCHSKMITGLEFIYPDGFDRMSPEDQENQKKNIRYATSSQDGTIKIWDSQKLEPIQTIEVAKDIWVTCICYMKGSGVLVAGSANRRISFYKLKSTSAQTPISRFEDLVGIPLCMEYYLWP